MMDAQAVLRCQDGDREAVHHREDQYQDLRAGRLKNSPRITRIRRKVLAAAGRCRIAAVVAGAALAVTVLAATACGEAQVVEKTATVTEVREVMEAAPRPAPTAAATAAPTAPPTAAPTAAAAATPRVVIKEVIKEVPVETVVTRVVIKEVPVETVVMKEVVKEVAVEKIVAAPTAAPMEASVVEKIVTVTVTEIKEVVTRDAAAAERAGEAAADTRPSRPVELTAGEVDDNQRWTDYLRYRDEYRGPPVHDVDVSERYTITVLDALGRPVPNAQVSISGGEELIFEGRTYANGQTLFFPRAFPGTANARTFRPRGGKRRRQSVARRQTRSRIRMDRAPRRGPVLRRPCSAGPAVPIGCHGQHGRRDRSDQNHALVDLGAHQRLALASRSALRDGHLPRPRRRFRHARLRLRRRRPDLLEHHSRRDRRRRQRLLRSRSTKRSTWPSTGRAGGSTTQSG